MDKLLNLTIKKRAEVILCKKVEVEEIAGSGKKKSK